MEFPYKQVMVAVDNSEYSSHATELAIELARAARARLTGVHVYAARLHDTRFRHLAPGLPERYQQEQELRRQRDIHDDLIGRGLSIISQSYLDSFEARCREADVPAGTRSLEGRNYSRLVQEARTGDYDLVVIGAHGLGRVDRSSLGSVCERVARMVERDVLVAGERRALASGHLLVAIDGSPSSYAALDAGLWLSHACGVPISAVAAYDPFYHSVAFAGIAGVLSEENARLFRFREQETLHKEVIDGGLREVYRAHLIHAQAIARGQGIDLAVEVLEGKPFDAIASHAERTRPSLLLAGRVGIHHEDGVTIGSTAENLLHCSSGNVLLVGAKPEGRDRELEREDASSTGRNLPWSEEARARLERVPFFARKMAQRRIESFARDNGYLEVDLEVYEKARRGLGM